MNLKYFVVIIFSCLFYLPHSYAYTANPRVKFERYSIGDGLSHLGVSSFFQDSKGFLWIGTFDGLNRFDGINFKVFKHIPDDTTSLVNNRVRCILEHSSGEIFIGTEGGLSVFNPEYEVFHELKFGIFGGNESVAILSMFEDSNERLWILTNRSVVYVINLKTNDVKSLFFVSNKGRKNVVFNKIVEDKHGLIWLATSNGLICYQEDFKQVTLDMPTYLTTRMIRTIALDSDQNLWVSFGSTARQLSLFYSEKKVQISSEYSLNIESIVLSILGDSKGNIWIGSTNEGIFRVVNENNVRTVENYTYKPSSPESLSSNWVSEIYEDNYGDIWFATAEKGVNKYAYDKGLFLNIDESSGVINDYIVELFQYDEEKLLIGTRRGFSVFNLKNEKVEMPWFDDSNINRRNNQVSEIYKDKDGYLWFGISGGLVYLIPGSTNQLVSAEHPDVQISNWYVVDVAEDNFGNLWVGTTIGLFRMTFGNKPTISKVLDFNTRSDKLTSNLRVSHIYVDPNDHSLWVGSWYTGLYHIKIDGDEENVDDFSISQFQFVPGHSETLRSNFISSILVTRNGDLWIGTEGGGLSVLKKDSETLGFKHYTEKEGLSNNVVKSILEDEKGRLYIGTNYKLNVFDPESESFNYYDVGDGLKSAFFNTVALTLSNNEMVFGGNEGITIFDPLKLEDNNFVPVAEFGDFQLSYKKVHPGEKINGKVLIEKNLAYTKEIHLKHFQNTFSIELLGINFDNPEDNYCRYRLKGYDQEWIFTNLTNSLANYSNVAPGEYVFEFDVSNDKNVWSANPKQLTVLISPPFWKTGWAYTIYIVLFLGIIITIFYFFLNMERLKSNLRIEQIEKEKEKEINDIKLRFFTNISHEFKTPVSLILAPVENLIQKFNENDSIKRNLSMIQDQANYLLRLVDQLLEFRKVEKENLELNCIEKDIVSFVRNIVKGFNPKSVEKNIRYDFRTEVEVLKVWFDPSKIEMIVYNLLSNAFKFTPSKGSISVFIETDTNFVIIKVIDSGPGIPKEEQEKIFERFYQSNSTAQLHGTGIGLTLSKSLTLLHQGELNVESELGNGATFILKLQLGEEHFSEKETIDSDTEILNSLVNVDHSIDTNSKEDQDGFEEKNNINLPTLLLVEDNFQMRKYLMEVLGESYHVISADNGNDGFLMACNKVPDIIVSDVMMPGIDGVELVEKLRNEIITSHIPIVLLTVKNEFDSYIRGIKTGADDYISKPFHIEHLLVRINNLLENRTRLRLRYSKDIGEDSNMLDEHFSNRDAEFIHTLYAIAEKSLDNSDFSADDFSRAVFMSRTNFYKKLKALTNQTPGEFLRSYRVKRAGEFLRSGEYSVSQVTQMVGFKSRSHFYQCFKSFYGELPTEFMRNKEEIS